MYKGTKRKIDDTMEESEIHKANGSKIDGSLTCHLCKVNLPNEISMRQHLQGHKHRKLASAEGEKERIEKKCGLFIRGYPSQFPKDAVLEYFYPFGKIVFVQFKPSFLLLDYEDPAVAANVINRVHELGGHRLTIQYRQPRRQAPKVPDQDDVSADVIQTLKDISNFDDQVTILLQKIQPSTNEQFPKYNKVCEDLYRILERAFPYCRIHPFGSTITGLGINNSDVDVFISGVKQGDQDVPYLIWAKRRLVQSRLFTNVIVIPHAKIPILKCVHVATGLSCDINMRNMLGVCNSNLINYYLSLDPKLRKLMIVLKFWARTHKITGQNHLFTNYSLNLMLIFFLQHAPFCIPSVLRLQRNPQFFNNQDGWNGGFEPLSFRNPQLIELSLLQLLEMFFDFYIKFDYGINIICPYLGKPLKKQQFKHPESLPDCYFIYKSYVAATGQHLKVDTAICIQDPFEHIKTATPIVSSTTLETFINLCRLGKKFCEEKRGPILFKLLTETPPSTNSLTVIKSESSKFVIPMRPSLKYIEEKYKTIAERHNAWFKSVTKFTTMVLKDILKFEVSEINTPVSNSKHMKAKGQKDVHDNLNELGEIRFKCNCKLNLWQARKSTAKANKPEVKQSIVEKEIAITEQICGSIAGAMPKDDVIKFEICFQFCADPPTTEIHIKSIAAYKNSFKSFITFFIAKLPAWFKAFEQEQCDS
ncbi:hypothetical protein NQ315_003854 [Exocentrus adspersus]|uniref:Speckle targeted PIP5K1A-regulated poly(A) polymerase n=1 Tax=Exocentrus adspersus TaxID=1586481 RepID=A0AAV8VYE5_9CUCU|nr:hypothetical protein NQ315_003854 [Exocentrus adspersus]